MKWIKTAIGAVIAVLTIGIIATTVYKMTRLSEVIREVSFEIDYEESKYYPISAYNKIVEYGVIDEENKVINIVSGYANDDNISSHTVFLEPNGITLIGTITSPDGDIDIDGFMNANGDWFDFGSTLNDNVNIKLVFEVTQPPQLTGINATLILLIPTVFAGGVLLYFYKPLKKD